MLPGRPEIRPVRACARASIGRDEDADIEATSDEGNAAARYIGPRGRRMRVVVVAVAGNAAANRHGRPPQVTLSGSRRSVDGDATIRHEYFGNLRLRRTLVVERDVRRATLRQRLQFWINPQDRRNRDLEAIFVVGINLPVWRGSCRWQWRDGGRRRRGRCGRNLRRCRR